MRVLFCLLFSFIFLISCNEKKVQADKTVLCIIGTQHDSCELINPASMYLAIEKVKPDVILCELEAKYFLGNTYNLAEYSDLLSTNENISSYNYQQKYNIDLRPYEIEGRNEYYKETLFFEKWQSLFSEIMNGFKDKTLSPESYDEWDRFLKIVAIVDIFHNRTLEEINSELYVQYSEAKDMILYNTFISVTKRDFPERYEDARMFKDFWDRRNQSMTSNILKWCEEYQGKTIVVLTGQQHKSQLLNYMLPQKEQYNIEIKEFWEPEK